MVDAFIPSLVMIILFVISIIVIMAGFIGWLRNESDGVLVFVVGVVILIVSIVSLVNIPQIGPYFDQPEEGKIYKLESVFELQKGKSLALIEWNINSKKTVPDSEMLMNIGETNFSAGNCLTLNSNKQLEKIDIQGCENNS